ncbi:MAG TPA: hypothetical protein VII94_04095 [Candidatus Saccharimonadales bacterium]
MSKTSWFRPIRRSYLPSSWQGSLIYLIYVAYIVVLAGDWYHLGHHGWTLIVNVIPLVVAAAISKPIYSAKTHSSQIFLTQNIWTVTAMIYT